jgi:exodeoxyribonuclease V alpha subunit
MSETIEGQIERVVYTNSENGYTIVRVSIPGTPGVTTVSGMLHSPSPGETLTFTGTWENHSKYGEQFKAESAEAVRPETLEGIELYLGSGLIKGLGPVMAKRIVTKFGLETLAVMDGPLEKLKGVEGIGAKRIKGIKEAWDEQREIRNVMIFLQSHGVGTAHATKIFRRYGAESLKSLRENPYRLSYEVAGIGFASADSIAASLGITLDSPERAEAGVRYVLSKCSSNGHVFYPYEPLIKETLALLELETREPIARAIATLAASRTVLLEDMASNETEATNEKAVYMSNAYRAELGIVGSLKEILKAPLPIPTVKVQKAVKWAQKKTEITLSDAQQEALASALTNKVLLITGGPGTGKTTLIKAIVAVFLHAELKVMLTAPTGRAAKRMQESTSHSASTIHRLLEINPATGGFSRDLQNPLLCDLLVVDELSMVDNTLMYELLKAVPRKGALVLVGDPDQLPSVGPGNVLGDMINSGTLPMVRLTEVHRQSSQSLIVTNAHKVNKGTIPQLTFAPDVEQDFYFFECDDADEVANKVVELCTERIPDKFGFNGLRDIQVIAPMHKGQAGVQALNSRLQDALVPKGVPAIDRGNRQYRTGDKVMQLVNNYDKDVFNGDIGIVQMVNTEKIELTVDFDGRPVRYESRALDELTLAYAVTVHKSQGSEYPVVVMPVHTQHFVMLQRNLLYTALTRARKLMVLVGSRRAIELAVKQSPQNLRNTMLAQRLKDLIKH